MGKIQITKAKDSKEKKDKKIKTITILLLIFFVILLLLSGYTFAKSIEATTINANATIAEPILVIENNPQLDITASQNTGTYIFKVKNYNNQKQTEIDLKYYIQVISDLDKSIELKLYENGKQIKFENNKIYYFIVRESDWKYKVYTCKYNGKQKKAMTGWVKKIPKKYGWY